VGKVMEGYIGDTFEHLGLPQPAGDPRFCAVLPLIEMRKPQCLKTMKGQGTPAR
jgi:hypothetical protein